MQGDCHGSYGRAAGRHLDRQRGMLPFAPMAATSALTSLSDEEQLVRDSVFEFADREIRPLVREMDEHGAIPRALVDKLFALGVMGIEVPESDGGGADAPSDDVAACRSRPDGRRGTSRVRR